LDDNNAALLTSMHVARRMVLIMLLGDASLTESCIIHDCDYQATLISLHIGYHFDLFSSSAAIIAARFGRGLCPSPYSGGVRGFAFSRGFSLGLSSCSGG
jgi:hypothetical protein